MDNLITLYEYNETSFTNLGLGVLPDVISCTVTNEVNGKYELSMEYPMSGAHFDDILNRRILYCSTSPFDDAKQAFRIYSLSKPIRGTVTIKAYHISYDLSDLYVLPFDISGTEDDPITVSSIMDELVSQYKTITGDTTFPFTFAVDDGYQTTWDASTNTPTLSTSPSYSDKGKCWKVSVAGDFNDISFAKGDWIVAKWTGDVNTGSGKWVKQEGLMEFKVDSPTSIKSILGSGDDTIIGKFGGEYHFDNRTVSWFRDGIGTDSGVTIRYGKNLTDLTQEENCSKVCTHVLPYYKSGDSYTYVTDEAQGRTTPLLTLAGYTAGAPKKVLSIDLTSEFESAPGADELYDKALEYIDEQALPNPEVSLTISFVQLTNAKEYQTLAMIENINLGDTLTVLFPRLNINTLAECVGYSYNVLTKKYVSMEIGELKSTIFSIVAGVTTSVDNVFANVHKSTIGKAITETAKVITGAAEESSVKVWNNETAKASSSTSPTTEVETDTHEVKSPNEIVVASDADIQNENTHVWVWNASGLTYRANGYNGSEKVVGISADGEINASLLKVGTIEPSRLGPLSITADKLSITPSTNNLIKNSVGLNTATTNTQDVFYWTNNSTGTCASVYKRLADADKYSWLINSSTSGSYIAVYSNKSIKQSISVVADKTYTLIFKTCCDASATQTTAAGTLTISSSTANAQSFDITKSKYLWGSYSCKIVPPSETITISIASTSSYKVFITDLMLIEGDVEPTWQPSVYETYMEHVTIDGEGITVKRNEGETRTQINHEEFAVWYSNAKRITVNSTDTQLRKTTINGELNFIQSTSSTSRAKFIPTGDGIDILI